MTKETAKILNLSEADRLEYNRLYKGKAEKVYTQDDVKKEIDYLKDHGYFDLPDDHKVNGTLVSEWKKFLKGKGWL